MNHFVYVKARDGIFLDSSHLDKYHATQRLIQLRREGKIVKMFTEDELMQMQYETQSQPIQQPVQQPIQRQRPKHRMGIVSLPPKRNPITSGREHIQRIRRQNQW